MEDDPRVAGRATRPPGGVKDSTALGYRRSATPLGEIPALVHPGGDSGWMLIFKMRLPALLRNQVLAFEGFPALSGLSRIAVHGPNQYIATFARDVTLVDLGFLMREFKDHLWETFLATAGAEALQYAPTTDYLVRPLRDGLVDLQDHFLYRLIDNNVLVTPLESPDSQVPDIDPVRFEEPPVENREYYAALALARIAFAQSEIDSANSQLDEAVALARQTGVSWARIGGVLGIHRNSAQNRWDMSAREKQTERARRSRRHTTTESD